MTLYFCPRANRAYTLIELLMVVVVLGIITALAVPQYYLKVERAQVSEVTSVLSAVRQGEKAYYLENRVYLEVPNIDLESLARNADWAKIGIENPNIGLSSGARKFSYNVIVNNSTIPPTFIARAQRIGAYRSITNPYSASCITLDQDGVFAGAKPGIGCGGDYPFIPNQ